LFKKFLSEQIGQSLVLTAIFLAVLIGFAGLTIDGGRLYLAKSQLQKAVDAGVLAGADA
jgi:Flp pilus assembly protein TadG